MFLMEYQAKRQNCRSLADKYVLICENKKCITCTVNIHVMLGEKDQRIISVTVAQGCRSCCSLAAGLRGNGERNEEMKRKWRENEEIERKWRENEEMDRE